MNLENGIFEVYYKQMHIAHYSPMVSGWAGGHPVGQAGVRAAGKSLSGLYLRNCKV